MSDDKSNWKNPTTIIALGGLLVSICINIFQLKTQTENLP
jgi:hypothetical protein